MLIDKDLRLSISGCFWLFYASKYIFGIYEFRGQKVMLDCDLAEMYGVQTKVLNQAVKRNIERFPSDVMFQISSEETQDWRSQFVTSNAIKME